MLWLDGEILDNEAAKLAATNAGVLLGHGVFTTLGVRNGAPLFLDLHLARLRRDAEICGLALTFSDRILGEATLEIIARNRVQNGAARLTLTARGDGFWDESAGTSLTILAKSRAPLPVFGLKALVFWGIAPALEGIKTTSYWPYSRAFWAAREHGCDDAILLGHDGFLAECARSTLFWVKDQTLHTPSLANGALRGVGREVALDFARRNGLYRPENQGQFALKTLLEADETFLLTGATGPRELRKLREPSGSETLLAGAGEIFTALRELWDK